MPAVLAQATVLTLVLSLGVWTGCVLLIIALLPKIAASARTAARHAPARLLVAGLPVAATALIFALLFHTGVHALKIAGMLLVLIGLAIACLGTCGVVLRIVDRFAPGNDPALPRVTAIPTIAASVLLASVIAMPRVGLNLFLPILFVVCGGVGIYTLIGLKNATAKDVVVRSTSGSTRAVLVGAGVLLAACIVPVWRAMSIEIDPLVIGTSDNTALSARVYVPAGRPPYPVVLIQSSSSDAADRYNIEQGVSHGYAVVVENTRGRYGSQGVNMPFSGLPELHPNDGWSTLEWLNGESWCNGKIGALGSFDDGIGVIATDGSSTDRLASQFVSLAAPSLYQYFVYPGGIYRQNDVDTWLNGARYAPASRETWLKHPTYDDFWLQADFDDRWDRIHWPGIHIGGWYDTLSQGAIDTFVGMQTRGDEGARDKQKLVLGPWTHNRFTAKAGEVTFPGGGEPPNDILDPWRWFDFTLLAKQNGLEKLPAVTYYVMGDTSTEGAPGNKWRTADAWPPANASDTPYYLHGGKLLSTAAPAAGAPLSYAFDPANPVPTTGGPQMYLSAGPVDQRPIENRPDVLTFTTAALDAPTEVTGRVRMKLYISSDAPDTDFFVKLCDVYPDGKTYNISEGQLRARFRYGFIDEVMLKPGQVYPLDIDLWSTSIVFNKGHKIQVIITSSNAPAFDVNANTGEQFRASSHKQVAHNLIYMDPAHPSAITLPIASKQ